MDDVIQKTQPVNDVFLELWVSLSSNSFLADSNYTPDFRIEIWFLRNHKCELRKKTWFYILQEPELFFELLIYCNITQSTFWTKMHLIEYCHLHVPSRLIDGPNWWRNVGDMSTNWWFYYIFCLLTKKSSNSMSATSTRSPR